VVEGGSALSRVEDTTSVGLEDGGVGLDGNGKGLEGEGSLHLVGTVFEDVSVPGSFNTGGGPGVVLAGTILSGVGVSGLSSGGTGDVVAESFVLPATVATVVGSGAVNELLFGEGEEVAGLDLVRGLHSRVG
jgi:hypothetical protein